MTQTVTPREQETLSAYLDNALNPRARQQLETQLQARPELRAALNDLRQTQQLLRHVPVLRAPRNFTLTPEMAGLRTQPPRVYPVFRLAFALASILFVFVVGGEMIFGGPTPASEVAMAPEAETFALEEAPLETMSDSQQVEEPSGEHIIGETPLEESGAGSAEMYPAPEHTPSPGEFIVAAEPPTPTLTPTYKGAPTSEVLEETIPSLKNPLTTTIDFLPPDVPLDDGGEDMSAPPAFWASPWRVPQFILGGIVLASAVGLFLFRRKTML
jgi:hypothetical protein